MTDSPAQVININNVSKRFGGIVALENVSLDIRAGEFHSIVGENGAGKSTLMKILAGVITDYDGELLVQDKPARFRGTKDAEAVGIGIIHQELNLVNDLSVAANVFLGREKRTRFGLLDDRGMERETEALLRELECPIQARTPVRRLRVGDQQLVEIAKALSLDAEVLIMDEPTSALTESEVERLFRVIDSLLAKGHTILYISHKMEEVFRRSDRITVLRDGHLVQTVDREQTNPTEITHLMVGREIEGFHAEHSRDAGDALLEVDNLGLPQAGPDGRWRLENISFTLRKGEVVGVAGLMGAGRTELLECLFGSSPVAPAGSIKLQGQQISPRHPSEAMAAGLALVTEDRKGLGLFGHLSVRENITVNNLREYRNGPLLSSRREKSAATESIDLLNVKTAGPEQPVLALSGGNQQKVVIARWLRTKPKALLLDDPTRGVDVGAKAEIYSLIDQLCGEGLGILVTSSELPELITLCDRILVLCEGRLTGEFAREDFSEHAIMEAATGQN